MLKIKLTENHINDFMSIIPCIKEFVSNSVENKQTNFRKIFFLYNKVWIFYFSKRNQLFLNKNEIHANNFKKFNKVFIPRDQIFLEKIDFDATQFKYLVQVNFALRKMCSELNDQFGPFSFLGRFSEKIDTLRWEMVEVVDTMADLNVLLETGKFFDDYKFLEKKINVGLEKYNLYLKKRMRLWFYRQVLFEMTLNFRHCPKSQHSLFLSLINLDYLLYYIDLNLDLTLEILSLIKKQSNEIKKSAQTREELDFVFSEFSKSLELYKKKIINFLENFKNQPPSAN